MKTGYSNIVIKILLILFIPIWSIGAEIQLAQFEITDNQEINEESSDTNEEELTLEIHQITPVHFAFKIEAQNFLIQEFAQYELEILSGSFIDQIFLGHFKIFKVLLRQIISPNAP